ncbi:M48 family metallopeptidase [Chloroflexota bacterium]
MNVYFWIIIFALLLNYLLDTVSNILNLRALKNEPPVGLEEIYQPDDYRKSQAYTRARTRFGFFVGSADLIILLVFWFTGGFNILDTIVRSWGFGFIFNGLLYTGIIVIGYELITLPFGIYSTFVIEEKFGFNKTTPRLFTTDRLKSFVIMLLLGGPLMAGILALFEYAGNLAWPYCWLVSIIYMVVMQFVAPVWIMPLFNKFTPMESGELMDAIQDYSRSAGYETSRVFVMDGSKRSTKSNAFFTGYGRTKRIALFDTLITNHTVPELVAIIAHEIGHYKKKHIIQGMVISLAHMGLIFYLLSVFLGSPGLYRAFYVEQASIYTGLMFAGMLLVPLETLLSIGMNVLSRKNEYQADRFAAETVDEPSSITGALKKLSTDNLSNLTPHPLYVYINYSHPTLLQRIQAVNRIKN